jgi:large subunit ribosomal protein L25
VPQIPAFSIGEEGFLFGVTINSFFMQSIVLAARIRDRATKDTGEKRSIPAVLYGRGIENKPLWIDYQQFKKIHNEAGESTVIDLSIEGNGDPRKVLIHDVQYHPVTDDFRHIDFFQVRMDEEITTEVELVFVGESPAVKSQGGVLVKNMDSIEVRCLPMDLPGEIQVDVSAIKTFDDHIYVKDLPISKKVEVDVDPETVVALVTPPRTSEELEQLDQKVEIDIEQVEGMKKEEKSEEETK